MTTAEQIPAMDAALVKIDRRIDKSSVTIMKLEEHMRTLQKRIDRVRRYRRELGIRRSRIATFELSL